MSLSLVVLELEAFAADTVDGGGLVAHETAGIEADV
jgi:hypothetical protein